jgi:hypothetical protein
MKPNRTTDQISLRLDPDWLDAARAHAAARDEGLTEFLRRAVERQIGADNLAATLAYARANSGGQLFSVVTMEA